MLAISITDRFELEPEMRTAMPHAWYPERVLPNLCALKNVNRSEVATDNRSVIGSTKASCADTRN
jgi:hypothetical protein